MDMAYENALKRKKELEAELSEIKLFLALYERFSGTELARGDPAPGPAGDAALLHDRQVSNAAIQSHWPVVEFGRQRGNPDIVAAMAEAVLKESGRPMTRGELATEIEKRGTELPTGDKGKYVGTILWRKADRFENIEGRGYWLKGVEISPDPISELADLIAKKDIFSK